jgi:spore coat polysaccharide biosynthesis predicted glycosyltransferase SpsG
MNIKIINILSQLKNLQKVSIIFGPALNYKPIKINEIIRKNKLKIKIYRYPKRLNDIYNCHNLAITAGGNTMFNFCAINLKNISISTNNMEIKNCKKMKKMNSTNYYDHYSNFNGKKFIKFFNKVILQKHIIKKKSLFNGVNEISKIITKSENSI